jgi:hypothetical protein
MAHGTQNAPPQQLPANLQTMLDRQEILDCLTRFARGNDRFDRDLVLSCFHPGAICDYGPYVGGPEGLFDWADSLRPQVTCTYHVLTNHSCDILGDTAHTETYLTYTVCRLDGTIWQANGRYLDRLERRNGEWKILFRRCIVEAAGTVTTCALPFEGVADLHKNGRPTHDRTDPSYQRPLANHRKLRNLNA